MRILIVEDDEDSRVYLEQALAAQDYEIVSAGNGVQALEYCRSNRPDLIISDIMMPEMDGYELCRQIKIDESLKDILFIFYTATYIDERDIDFGLSLGALHYLIKPMEIMEFLAVVKSVVQKIETETFAENRIFKDSPDIYAKYSEVLNRKLTKKMRELEQERIALRESENKYKDIIDYSPLGIYKSTIGGEIIFANQQFAQILGYESTEELLKKNITDIYVDLSDRSKLIELIEEGIEQKSFEIKWKRKDGKPIWIMNNVRIINDEFGNIRYFEGFVIDIDLRKKHEFEVQKLLKAVEQNPVSIVITDEKGNIEYVNQMFTKVTGYTFDEVTGQNPRILKSGIHSEDFYQKLWSTILSGNNWNGEIQNKKKNGELYWEHVLISPIVTKKGQIINFVGVKEDITEKKLLIKNLIEAKEKAEESDRLKTAFLANISHEIRTPMNGILGFAGLLKEKRLSREEQENFVNIIEKSGERMLNTINDLIDISKIESKLVITNRSVININKQINYLYTFFKPETDRKGLQFNHFKALPDEKAIIYTDEEKLNSVLTNLVKNAIKYTDKGKIEFGYQLSNNSLLFYVKDTGIGVVKNKQEAIFERFVQADISTTKPYEGSGLGLSIAKAYIEMLKGKIWVESEEGNGSHFFFTIPFEEKVKEENKQKNMVVPQYTDEILADLSVLLVEDDEISSIYLSELLKGKCKNIYYAKNGKEAVEIHSSRKDINLILMDIKLPVMDGYSATAKIRETDKNILIIAQTAYALEEDRAKALSAGCNEYVTKPILKKDLVRLIEKIKLPKNSNTNNHTPV